MQTYIYCAIFLILGYVLGKLDGIFRLLRRSESESFAIHNNQNKNSLKKSKKVLIDETKFVTDVSTEDMQPNNKFAFGEVIQTDDNIASAANKLAQFKKLKG